MTACLANLVSIYKYTVLFISYINQMSKIRISIIKWETNKRTELLINIYNVFETKKPFEIINNYSGKKAIELLYIV